MRSIQIYYPDPVTGALQMQFFNGTIEQVSGVQVLLNRISKLLMTKSGTNYFSPESGSALGDKRTVSFSDQVQFELVAHDAVSSIETQIINEQTLDNGVALTPDQQLESLTISNIYQDPTDPTGWYLELLVHTLANQSYFITV